MPAPDRNNPVDPLRFLVHGVVSAGQRNTVQENMRRVSGWISFVLINNYAAPPDPFIGPQYRMDMSTSSLEFRGHVDVSDATTNTIMGYLAQPFWPPYDITFITDVTNGVGSHTTARVSISSVNGSVTMGWPAG